MIKNNTFTKEDSLDIDTQSKNNEKNLPETAQKDFKIHGVT